MNQNNFDRKSWLNGMRVTMVTPGVLAGLLAQQLVMRGKPWLEDGPALGIVLLPLHPLKPPIMNVLTEADVALEAISMWVIRLDPCIKFND